MFPLWLNFLLRSAPSISCSYAGRVPYIHRFQCHHIWPKIFMPVCCSSLQYHRQQRCFFRPTIDQPNSSPSPQCPPWVSINNLLVLLHNHQCLDSRGSRPITKDFSDSNHNVPHFQLISHGWNETITLLAEITCKPLSRYFWSGSVWALLPRSSEGKS